MNAVFVIRRFPQLTAFAAALAFAACGGDGGSIAPAPTPVAPPQPAPAPPPTPVLPVTVSFSPEAVALFEGESAEIAVRYQVLELSAPWKLGLSVLGDTAGEDDFELSADTVEIPAGQDLRGELPIVLTARTDGTFAEESERASIRFVPDPDQSAALGGELRVSIRDRGAFPCPEGRDSVRISY